MLSFGDQAIERSCDLHRDLSLSCLALSVCLSLKSLALREDGHHGVLHGEKKRLPESHHVTELEVAPSAQPDLQVTANPDSIWTIASRETGSHSHLAKLLTNS